MADQFLCEKCGRHSAPAGADAPRFCAHCGGPLKVVAKADDDVIPFADDAIPAPPPIDVKIPPIVVPPVQPPPIDPPAVPIPANAVTELTPPSPPPKKFGPMAEPDPDPAGDPLDFREEMVRCPNCGKQNSAATEICTNCGYSRSLGRTLTTRVRSTEPEPTPPPPPKATERGIAAEKEYANQDRRSAMNPASDHFRIYLALLVCAALAALILAVPKYPYQPPDLELHGYTFHLPELRRQDALGHFAVLFLLATPLLTLGTRITFGILKTKNPSHLTSMRAAGILALLELTVIALFYFQFTQLHLAPQKFIILFWSTIAGVAILFTWYLQNIRFFSALICAILALIVSAAAFWFFITMMPGLIKQIGL